MSIPVGEIIACKTVGIELIKKVEQKKLPVHLLNVKQAASFLYDTAAFKSLRQPLPKSYASVLYLNCGRILRGRLKQ